MIRLLTLFVLCGCGVLVLADESGPAAASSETGVSGTVKNPAADVAHNSDLAQKEKREAANQFLKEGKFAEAAANYRELIRIDQISPPPSPYAGSDLFALGSVLMELNRVDDAKACYEAALTVFKDNPVDAAQVRVSLGGAQVIQGLFLQAEASMKTAIAELEGSVGTNDIRTARAYNVSSWLYTLWGA